jgi:hypothetical protein
MIDHRDLSMTDRYAHLTLNRQRDMTKRLTDYYKADSSVVEERGGLTKE